MVEICCWLHFRLRLFTIVLRLLSFSDLLYRFVLTIWPWLLLYINDFYGWLKLTYFRINSHHNSWLTSLNLVRHLLMKVNAMLFLTLSTPDLRFLSFINFDRRVTNMFNFWCFFIQLSFNFLFSFLLLKSDFILSSSLARMQRFWFVCRAIMILIIVRFFVRDLF